MIFFVGLHQPADAKHFDQAFVSVNRLRGRRAGFAAGDWIMDSGAFSEITTHGRYRHEVEEYAAEIRRWSANGNLIAAVTQDYMCEPFATGKTGLTIEDHQRLTIERYDALAACDTAGIYIMPVLQGQSAESYAEHVTQYGGRLQPGAWVGVGSVCKRNGKPGAVAEILKAILAVRPDLRLHGFGLKKTALACDAIVSRLFSADSMAWSFAARRNGRNANDWKEAERFVSGLSEMAVQMELL